MLSTHGHGLLQKHAIETQSPPAARPPARPPARSRARTLARTPDALRSPGSVRGCRRSREKYSYNTTTDVRSPRSHQGLAKHGVLARGVQDALAASAAPVEAEGVVPRPRPDYHLRRACYARESALHKEAPTTVRKKMQARTDIDDGGRPIPHRKALGR